MMKISAIALISGVLLAATAAFFASTATADDAAACGSRTNPCPLQKWMQENIGSKMADGNLSAVATGLDKATALNPDPAWTDWGKFAKDGAAAARKGGDDGVVATKAACKGCHDKYKADYKTRFRTRAVP